MFNYIKQILYQEYNTLKEAKSGKKHLLRPIIKEERQKTINVIFKNTHQSVNNCVKSHFFA